MPRHTSRIPERPRPVVSDDDARRVALMTAHELREAYLSLLERYRLSEQRLRHSMVAVRSFKTAVQSDDPRALAAAVEITRELLNENWPGLI